MNFYYYYKYRTRFCYFLLIFVESNLLFEFFSTLNMLRLDCDLLESSEK